MDLVLSRDIPKLMEQFPHEGHYKTGVADKVAAALPPVPTGQQQLTGPPTGTGDLYDSTRVQAPQITGPTAGMAQLALTGPSEPAASAAGSSAWDGSAPTARGESNPFGAGDGGGAGWAISASEKSQYDEVFNTLSPQGGKVSGAAVRPVLERSELPVGTLRKVWELSDVDKDGHLDGDEFALAMHLVRSAVQGEPLPAKLQPNLVPPSKRGTVPEL
mmetsp:Transcript_3152/g.9118  ORF Transcript_3152/g.9118 Transcript_3152/m.9118 type:complete len:217 (-) Transcript_3152:512-1162(-)